MSYSVSLAKDAPIPAVQQKQLRYKRGLHDRPGVFLDGCIGQGYASSAVEDVHPSDNAPDRQHQQVALNTLAIKDLGAFERCQSIRTFKHITGHGRISHSHIDTGHGCNVAIFLNGPKAGTHRVPGIASPVLRSMDKNSLTLHLQDRSFRLLFPDRDVSDRVLLYDPAPDLMPCVAAPGHHRDRQLQLVIGQLETSPRSADSGRPDRVARHYGGRGLVKYRDGIRRHRRHDNQNITPPITGDGQRGHGWQPIFKRIHPG
ncbi:hypothetical protein FUT69_07990 [Xylella taiwanensis]|nr:hypothetical protein [Xylella taiwanensis]MCD8456730.1 hypothetical protein [Xylella taiwanensis]MCD8459139.1 hypothetical protein [Xylella taiwanensis]MCD8461968.1 hypothetical protein [Xylella taiwanensis]MCD8464229.1 hypothetical protein [Xylella taiwanensis]MCD8465784.1 hypothetical protein [Xylella taiwanensis]